MEHKESKDDDLDGVGSQDVVIKDLSKENKKIEEQIKKNSRCCGGGKNKKKDKKKK